MCVCACQEILFIIVNYGKGPASSFKRLSEKLLTAASRRNSEMPNQHFVIGIRKLHPLCNNMFLFGELPNGLLPIQTWLTDPIILYKNMRPRKTIIIYLRPRSGHGRAHKYKWDVTYRTNLIVLKSHFNEWDIIIAISLYIFYTLPYLAVALFDKVIIACTK